MRVFVFATNTSPRSSSVGRSPCDTLALKRSRTAFAYSSCERRRTGVGPTMFGSLHSVSAETPTPGIGPEPPVLPPAAEPPLALEPPAPPLAPPLPPALLPPLPPALL